MTEQELYNEYRSCNYKSFTDFLINKIAELKEQNAELKSEKGCESCTKFDEVKLAKAKEIVENFLKEFERMDVLCNYQLRTQAEQFLNEVENE